MGTGVAIAATLLLLPAVAQGQNLFESKAGVQIPIPEGFAQVSALSVPTTNAKSANAIEAAFNATKGDEAVVSMVVMNVPVENTRTLLAGLPRESGPTPESLAANVVAGMKKAAPGAREDSKTIPLRYDKTRKAYGLELQSTGPSEADAMLLLPDESPEWREVAETGAKTTEIRCIMKSMSAAYKGGRSREAVGEAAKQCRVTEKVSAAFVKGAGWAIFRSRRVVERLLTVTTTRGVTCVKLDAAAGDRALLDSAWTSIWTGMRVLPSVAPSDGLFDGFTLSKRSASYAAGVAFGIVIGAVSVGLLIARLVRRRNRPQSSSLNR
jgi:hypothetical protein